MPAIQVRDDQVSPFVTFYGDGHRASDDVEERVARFSRSDNDVILVVVPANGVRDQKILGFLVKKDTLINNLVQIASTKQVVAPHR